MNGFLQRHAGSVTGMLSGFDRVRFRGTVRLLANAGGVLALLSRTHRYLLSDKGRLAITTILAARASTASQLLAAA